MQLGPCLMNLNGSSEGMPVRDDSGIPNQDLSESHPDRIMPPVALSTEMDVVPRGGTGRLLPTLDTRERDREVYRLRIHVGLTWQEIADRLGYADGSGPAYAFKRVIDAIPKQISEDARNQSIAHLEALRQRLLAMLDEEYFAISNGRVVFDPIREVPLRDRGPVLAAIDRLVKIEMDIAKLSGALTDSPVVVNNQINYVIEGVDMDKLR